MRPIFKTEAAANDFAAENGMVVTVVGNGFRVCYPDELSQDDGRRPYSDVEARTRTCHTCGTVFLTKFELTVHNSCCPGAVTMSGGKLVPHDLRLEEKEIRHDRHPATRKE